MTAFRPVDRPLIGRFISLAPFVEDDIPKLFRVLGHPEVFAGGHGGGPPVGPPISRHTPPLRRPTMRAAPARCRSR